MLTSPPATLAAAAGAPGPGHPVLGHAGQPLAPHDVWTTWNPDPVVLVPLAILLWLHHRGATTGRRPRDRWRDRAFVGAWVALVVALVSPLEALSGELASAHMVQHVVLLLVAAPLLARSAPGSRLLRGSPGPVKRGVSHVRRRLRTAGPVVAVVTAPLVVWIAHVLVVWGWHAAAVYQAALSSQGLHMLEHVTFVATGVAFWRLVAGPRGGAARVSHGVGVLLVFGTAMQGVFLSALLTFATQPWYPAYDRTAAFGLTPLADQHLAGVIMWIPGSAVYVTVAVGLLVAWLRRLGDDAAIGPSPAPAHHRTPRRPRRPARLAVRGRHPGTGGPAAAAPDARPTHGGRGGGPGSR